MFKTPLLRKKQVKPNHVTISFSENITAQVIAIFTEAAQGHNTGIDAATIGAAHNDCIPPIEATTIDPAVTCHINHITDRSHIEVLQLINPEITVDHTHDHATNLQGRTNTDHIHIPADHEESHTSRRSQW